MTKTQTMHSVLKYGDVTLEYFVWGNGPKLMLAFHGFGQTGTAFQELGELLGPAYTLVSVSLPHHGKSEYCGKPLSTEAFCSAIDALLSRFGTHEFSMIGYSTGGRVALCIAPYFNYRLEHLLLIAPDGIVHHSLYFFATKTKLGRYLHRSFVDHPVWVYRCAKLVLRFGLVRSVQVKFLQLNSDTQRRRKLAYDTWGTLRKMEPDLFQLRAALIEYRVPVNLYFGEYDRIIPAKHGYAFTNVLPFARLHVLKKGHRLTTKPVFEEVVKAIKNPAKGGIQH